MDMKWEIVLVCVALVTSSKAGFFEDHGYTALAAARNAGSNIAKASITIKSITESFSKPSIHETPLSLSEVGNMATHDREL